MNMQVDLLLQNDQVHVPLDLQIVLAGVNLGLQLFHLFLLLVEKLVSLIFSILLSQFFDSLCLLDFKDLQLFSVVLSFFNTFVDGDKLLVLLHFFKSGFWFDLNIFGGAVQLLIEDLHLLLVILLEIFNSHQALIFVLFELPLPISVEFLKLIVADVDVLSKLVLLDMGPQFVLIAVDICFKKSDLAHQILIESVLLDVAKLLSQNRHLFFDQ